MVESATPSLSIALIMFNEEHNIAAALDETLAFCQDTLDDWEIIVVDDGSTDRSCQQVEPYLAKDNRIRLVKHEANRGMGAAIRTGIRIAQKDYFVFNATDGQIAATEIGKLVNCLEGADLVLSTYANRRETLGRELMSRAFRLYLRALAGIRFQLQGLYLYPTKTAQEIAPQIGADTFFFNFELIKRGLDRGLTATTTQITCIPRASGTSRVANPKRILKVAKDALVCRLDRRVSYKYKGCL